MDAVFANCNEEEEIYPLTTVEIAEAQRADATYKHLFKRNAVIDQGLEIKLIENTLCVCKEGRLVIPKLLKRRAVLWLGGPEVISRQIIFWSIKKLRPEFHVTRSFELL
jgi:hypothetical protein